MIPPVHGSRPRWIPIAVLLPAVFVGAWLAAPGLVASKLRTFAAGRGLTATWGSLSLRPPLVLSLRDLSLVAAPGDTVVRITAMDVAIDPLSLLTFAPRPARLMIDGARITTHPPKQGDPVAASPPVRPGRHPRADRLPRLRETARRAARLLMLDPARLRVSLRDVTVIATTSSDEPRTALKLDSLELRTQDGGTHLSASGLAGLEDDTPFTLDVTTTHEGRVLGGADFRMGAPAHMEHLPIRFDARIQRGGVPSTLRLEPGSTIEVGPIPLAVSGSLEPGAPRVRFELSARGVKPEAIARRIPASLLGPLTSVRVRGSFDYALSFDLDLERPDSVAFHADVTSHGLSLDPAATALNLLTLDAPFVAAIHLPRGRIVRRDLSRTNPHFRSFEEIDSTLALAVVTNEDGGFFRHRGFNTEAVKDAIAENLRAGAFRRGAGTITMQLARNLYLGHERTLSRKAQEVVLAWILEHLSGAPKRRLLEIYLNIIEWGPGIHGADEACHYYFGHDAGHVSVDEALFLATVVPAPTRWKNRFERNGTLRSFERAQMHFIGRAMVAKGWLDGAALPPAEALRVELRGAAGDALGLGADTSATTPELMESDAAAPPN